MILIDIKFKSFRYVGVTVLAMAKWLMYEFHYNHCLPAYNIDPKVNENVKLLMTDTDSLVYQINLPASQVYQQMKQLEWMDFSNYKHTSNLKYRNFYSEEKHLQPGFFKDETAGVYICEFCGKWCNKLCNFML